MTRRPGRTTVVCSPVDGLSTGIREIRTAVVERLVPGAWHPVILAWRCVLANTDDHPTRTEEAVIPLLHGILKILSPLQVRCADLVELRLNRRPLLDGSIRGALLALIAARRLRIVRVHSLCPELPVNDSFVALRGVIW